jgi:hypothetical protein
MAAAAAPAEPILTVPPLRCDNVTGRPYKTLNLWAYMDSISILNHIRRLGRGISLSTIQTLEDRINQLIARQMELNIERQRAVNELEHINRTYDERAKQNLSYTGREELRIHIEKVENVIENYREQINARQTDIERNTLRIAEDTALRNIFGGIFNNIINTNIADPYPVMDIGIRFNHHSIENIQSGQAGGWYLNFDIIYINENLTKKSEEMRVVPVLEDLHISIHLNPDDKDIPRRQTQTHIKFKYGGPYEFEAPIYFYLDNGTIKICNYMEIANNIKMRLYHSGALARILTEDTENRINISALPRAGLHPVEYISFLLRNAFIQLFKSFEGYLNYFYNLPDVKKTGTINYITNEGRILKRSSGKHNVNYIKYLKYKNKYLELKKQLNDIKK